MTAKADELIRKIEEAGRAYDEALVAETERVVKGLKDLQERLTQSGVLSRAMVVLKKHGATDPDGVFMPLSGKSGGGYAIGLRLDGSFAHRHEQRKSITVEEAAKHLALEAESRFPADPAEVDECVERYLSEVLDMVERNAKRIRAKSQPHGDWIVAR